MYSAVARRSFRVVLFGNDDVSVATFSALLKCPSVSSLAVVCTGNSQLYHMAEKHNLDRVIAPDDPKLDYTFPKGDLLVSASFGRKIPGSILSSFPNPGINMHPSLLPQYRGAAPLHHTLLNGDRISGISVITLDPKFMDTGGLLVQRKVLVPPHMTYTPFRAYMAEIGGAVISHAVSHYDELIANAQLQQTRIANGVAVSRAPKVNPMSDGRILPQSQTVMEVYNRWRAMEHVWAELGKNRILLQKLSQPTPESRNEHPLLGTPPPGTLWITKEGLKLRLTDGSLKVDQIMRAGGKRPLSGDDFNHGFMRNQPVLLS